MDQKIKRRLIVLVLALILSVSLFVYVGSLNSNFNKTTAITFDNTKINEGDSIVGHLVDKDGNGIANKLITFHKPGYEMGTLVTATTDENGTFIIENAEYLADAGKENYYGNFAFAGDDEYEGCSYDSKLTIIPK